MSSLAERHRARNGGERHRGVPVELVGWVLGFGKEAIVLEPDSRRKIPAVAVTPLFACSREVTRGTYRGELLNVPSAATLEKLLDVKPEPITQPSKRCQRDVR